MYLKLERFLYRFLVVIEMQPQFCILGLVDSAITWTFKSRKIEDVLEYANVDLKPSNV